MVGIGVQFQIQGDADSIQKLRELQSGDFSKPLAQVGVRLERSTKLRMSQGLKPDGSPQKPLASYEDKKTGKKMFFRKKGRKDKNKEPIPLLDTGRLMNSVTHQVVSPNELQVGTNVSYGRTHQEGGPSQILVERKKNKKITKGKNKGKYTSKKVGGRGMATAYYKTIMVPARPFIGFSPLDIVIIEKILANHFKF